VIISGTRGNAEPNVALVFAKRDAIQVADVKEEAERDAIVEDEASTHVNAEKI
jgi:hypothetical protein